MVIQPEALPAGIKTDRVLQSVTRTAILFQLNPHFSQAWVTKRRGIRANPLNGVFQMPERGILLVLAAVTLFSCQVFAVESENSGALPDFDLGLASRLLDEENGLLLDIRTEAEFQLGHITGATFIPFLEFSQYLSKIEKLPNNDRDRPIVLYCRTGRRAGIVKKVLLQEGYTRVTNMGGMKAWRNMNGK